MYVGIGVTVGLMVGKVSFQALHNEELRKVREEYQMQMIEDMQHEVIERKRALQQPVPKWLLKCMCREGILRETTICSGGE